MHAACCLALADPFEGELLFSSDSIQTRTYTLLAANLELPADGVLREQMSLRVT